MAAQQTTECLGCAGEGEFDCETCEGLGEINGQACDECTGIGKTECEDCDGSGVQGECPACGGPLASDGVCTDDTCGADEENA